MQRTLSIIKPDAVKRSLTGEINSMIQKNNIKIVPIPGPSAVATAISISGFSDQFFFYGFLPDKNQQITNELKKISEFNSTLVFFISSKKINKIIPEIKKYFGERKIVICREITKLYEEFLRANVNELEQFQKEPKGELTVVISDRKTDQNNSKNLNESDINIINKMINKPVSYTHLRAHET